MCGARFGPCIIASMLFVVWLVVRGFILYLQLGIDDFAQVQEALWEARSKWHNIGTRLKLGVFDLDCINSEPGFGLDDKFNLMIKTRLKRMEPCTWRDLYDALNHPTVDMPSVANKFTAKLPFGT